MTVAALRLEDMLEKEFQAQVVDLARRLGWTIYHTFNSRRSAHGFPDLVLVRERIVYLELKREKGALTDDQKRWLRLLTAAGGQAYVARPRDLQALANLLGNPRADTPLAALTEAEAA